jgi:hypothetical protein
MDIQIWKKLIGLGLKKWLKGNIYVEDNLRTLKVERDKEKKMEGIWEGKGVRRERMKEKEMEKVRTEKEEEESGMRGGNVPFINTRAAWFEACMLQSSCVWAFSRTEREIFCMQKKDRKRWAHSLMWGWGAGTNDDLFDRLETFRFFRLFTERLNNVKHDRYFDTEG